MVPTSSFIGVAIACGGNVLISLALTVQKLAHRRQSDELSHSPSPSSSRSTSPSNDSPEDNPIGKPIPASGQTTIPILMVPETSRKPITNSSESESTVRIVEPDLSRSLNLPDTLHEENHDDEVKSENRSVEEGAYLKSKLWWLGLGLMSVGEGGNFLSYGFAPASVVAPLGTVALIANCAFAPLILGERFRLRDLIGVGLAIVGAVTVVWASNDTNPSPGPSELIAAISQPIFIGYTITTCVVAVILMVLSRLPQFGPKYIGIDVGICALFGGYTVLSTKALSSLLSRLFLRSFEYPITWVLVFVLVGTSVCQIKYLNKALMNFESKEVIPTQFVFFSLAAIIGSAVLYQEFRDVAFTRLINFVFGIATTFLGVHLLTSTFDRNSHPTPGDTPPEIPSDQIIPHSHRNSLTTLSNVDEHTPLLIPAPLQSSLAALARSTSIGSPSFTYHQPSGTIPTRMKLGKRPSTTGLGLNSQAGFLLLTTTPPGASVIGGGTMGGRVRSSSRARSLVGDDEQGSRSFRPSGWVKPPGD